MCRIIFVWYFFLINSSLTNSAAAFITKEELSDSINQGINFLAMNMLNEEAAFYLVIASGELWYLQETVKISEGWINKINEYRNRMFQITNITAIMLEQSHKNMELEYKRIKTLWNPSDWKRNHDSRFRFNDTKQSGLGTNEVELIQRYERKEIDNYCENNLLDNGRHSGYRSCNIMEECYNINTNKDVDFNVNAVPQRLKYVLFGRVLNCTNLRPQINELINKFCNHIARLTLNVEELNYPVNLRNYFMDGILMCGADGFSYYYQYNWLEHVKNWQNSEGAVLAYNADVNMSTGQAIAIFSSALRLLFQQESNFNT